MATTVMEMSFPQDETVFFGSSEEDKVHAKTFWQSVQLLPTMESRLVSSNIKQRLKVAPPGSQPINVTYPPFEEPMKLQEFFENARMQEKGEEMRRIDKLSSLRQADLGLLHKHREQRIQKESISSPYRPRKQLDAFELPVDSGDEDTEDAAAALRQLDQFDLRINGQSQDSDSD